MSNKSKQKGNRFERLVVKLTKEAGIPAKRAWGSNGAALGHHEEVDVLIDNTIKVQCKCRAKIAEWMIPNENVDIQLIKEDRGMPLVVMPYEDYLELLLKVKKYEKKLK